MKESSWFAEMPIANRQKAAAESGRDISAVAADPPSGCASVAAADISEKEITLDEAEHLMELCEPGIVDKTRYLVKCGSHVFEVDEFHGDNAGLVMAEVELMYENEPYERPDFLGDEVTGDRRFYNSHLRGMPFILWRGTIPKAFRHIELE